MRHSGRARAVIDSARASFTDRIIDGKGAGQPL
jgi:hypothetical protein